MTIQQKIERRQEANEKINSILHILINQFPQWRMGQIMYNVDLARPNSDPFFDESVDILNRLISHPIVYPLISGNLTDFKME